MLVDLGCFMVVCCGFTLFGLFWVGGFSLCFICWFIALLVLFVVGGFVFALLLFVAVY